MEAVQTTEAVYTPYTAMNKMLTEFIDEAADVGIWVSVEAQSLRENHLREEYCGILRQALDLAADSCGEVMSAPPKYIKLRSSNIQRQALTEIRFSCGETKQSADERACALQDRVEKARGYMKLRMGADEGVLRIAIPCRS